MRSMRLSSFLQSCTCRGRRTVPVVQHAPERFDDPGRDVVIVDVVDKLPDSFRDRRAITEDPVISDPEAETEAGIDDSFACWSPAHADGPDSGNVTGIVVDPEPHASIEALA